MKKPVPTKRLLKITIPIVLAVCFLLLFTGSKGLKRLFEREENEENESPAQVYGAFDMWSDMRSYPDYNAFQSASYHKAFEYSRKMPIAPRKAGLSASGADGFPAWQALGPMNFSGRILCLAFHPTNQNIMFAGSATGGLWKTTNGGTGGAGGINWTQVSTGFPILGVPAIAINPKNASEMYIGTGEVYNTGGNGFAGQNVRTFRGSYGVGILKSTDGGTTWSASLPFTNSSIKGVQKIIIDTANPARVYAATSDGVYRSTNSGASWTLIHNVIMAMDICFEPGNTNTIYVGCGDFASAGNGIYKCTNATAGSPTFTQLTTGLPGSINGAIRLSVCPNNVNIVYASIGKIPGSLGGTAGSTYGLFKSTDAGATWAATGSQPQLGGSNYIQNQGWYSHDVIVAPTGVNTVYVSEIDMLKSTNGGASFSKISDWSKWDFNNVTVGATSEGLNSSYVHADHHHLYFSPFDATYNTIFVVTDGGVFKSTNAGSTFIGLNGGLMTTQIYHNMSISAINSNYMLCGLQDNATLWYSGGTGCKRTTGGDGFYTVIDPTNDQICFGTYSYLTLYRSTTGPASLGSTMIFSNFASGTTSTPPENACFVAPVVMAPSDHNRMYGGTINFKQSTDNGQTFTDMVAPLVNASAPIISIAVSSTYADSLYVATCPGGGANPKLLKSIDGGTSFTDVTGTLPNRYFSDIAVDPKNSKRLAVSISGFGTSHLFLSSDAGATWTSIGGAGGTALPDVPANVVLFDPNNSSIIYVGNDLGVYGAQGITNGASQPAWYAYNVGLTDATMVMDLLVAPNGKLRMGSYGKGLWQNDVPNFALPVEFSDFAVSATNKGNRLQWVIATQTNVDHYEIEYSTDLIHYTKVGSVSAINASTAITYSYLHQIQNVVDGYYRIKTVDADGGNQYSSVKQVMADRKTSKLSVYPNPTNGAFTISLPAGTVGATYIKLYDNAGKLVMMKKINVDQNQRMLPFDISNLSAGNYHLGCENGRVQSVTTILKN